MTRKIGIMLMSGWTLATAGVSQATTIVKANNTHDLNLASSWETGVVPGDHALAHWNSTVLGANSALLGADHHWRGIVVSNPGGLVTIGGTHTLTLGGNGVAMSAATANLTISCGGLTLLAHAGQTWDVASGRVVTASPTVFTRGVGASLRVIGAGTVAGAAWANDASGILGPWAITGIGTGARYVTVSGGSLLGYSGGTGVATAAGVTGTTGALNYDVAAVGALGANASVHTLRYTGGAGTITGALRANGLLNAGTGALTFSGAIEPGANGELVLFSPDTTRALHLAGPVGDQASGPSRVTIAGGGHVWLGTNNTYRGGTTVSSGALVFGRAASRPTAGTVTVAAEAGLGLGLGGTGAFTSADVDALWGNTMTGVTLHTNSWIGIDTSGGNATHSSSYSGTRRLIKTGNNTLTLTGLNTYSGGTAVRAGALAISATSALPGWNTPGAYEVWRDAGLAVGNAITDANIATMLNTGNFVDGACIGFDTSAADRTYALPIHNTAAGALGLYKVGSRMLTITGNSSYDGNTYVNGGILRIANPNAFGSGRGLVRVDDNGHVRIHGNMPLTITNDFVLNGFAQESNRGPLCNVRENNTLMGTIWIQNHGRISVEVGHLVLNGPVRLFGSPAASQVFSLNALATGGGITVSNVINVGAGTVNFVSPSIINLNAAGHTWATAQIQFGNTLRLGVENAFPAASDLVMGDSSNPGTLDLQGRSVTVGRFRTTGSAGDRSVITNSRPDVVSTFTLNNTAGNWDTFAGRFSGAVNLVKSGHASSRLMLTNAANSLSGSVTVTGGTLAIGPSGSLGAACTNVVVQGSAWFTLENSKALSENATLRLQLDSVGKVSLAAGVNQTVAYLVVHGVVRRAGTYGSTASAAMYKDDTLFASAGAGILTVTRDHSGTLIRIK